MTVPWDLHYDRRVTPEFLAHFRPGGVARSLVEYARHAPYPVDLQLRHDPKTKAEHASLYVGLTAVLSVYRKPGGLALDAHPTHKKNYVFGGWTEARDPEAWRGVWQDVERYLERAIPGATVTHAAKEGAVQAAASVFEAADRLMLDREAALHFRDNQVKTAIMAEETGPVVAALQAVGSAVPGTRPTSFGGEIDLLAVDEKGRLLAVEVKPANVGSIRWAAAQATVYARLLRRWIGQNPRRGTEEPGQILRGMIQQRVDLGLAKPTSIVVPDRPEVVPVVAIGRGARAAYVDSLRTVQEVLVEQRVGEPGLLLREVTLAGRLDPL